MTASFGPACATAKRIGVAKRGATYSWRPTSFTKGPKTQAFNRQDTTVLAAATAVTTSKTPIPDCPIANLETKLTADLASLKTEKDLH